MHAHDEKPDVTENCRSSAADGNSRSAGSGPRYCLKEFTVHGDSNGSLIAIEELKDIPFKIKRVYYIYGTTKHAVRGHHSHKQLEQIIFCPMGSCDFILDDGERKKTVKMDMPNKALYIKGNIWREFTNFSPNCVVMVLASLNYDEGDYIKDYEEFLAEANKAKKTDPDRNIRARRFEEGARMCDPSSVVQSGHIGHGTRIWQFCVVLPGAVIGANCNIAAHCFIENEVVIGNNVTIKCGVQLWDGITVEDGVFIGPNVTFTNDRHPRSQNPDWVKEKTLIGQGASIGANATILPGVVIGKNAVIGAGSVVTRSIPDGSTACGVPARITRTALKREQRTGQDNGQVSSASQDQPAAPGRDR